jgi:hypothetical protein
MKYPEKIKLMPPLDTLANRVEKAEEDIQLLRKRINTIYRFLQERAEAPKEE